MKLRIKFTKSGSMKFIGHLDMMRYFQKAIRRAKLDVIYTGGYSPHQIMSFAAPLGVGLESNGEYLDIEVNSVTTSTEMINQLNSVMVDGIEILSMKELPTDAGNAMASVAAASYLVKFRSGKLPPFDLYSQLEILKKMESIIIVKQTKKSSAELDLKPFIFDLRKVEDQDEIYMFVDSSSAGNIKPKYVIDALYAINNMVLDEFDLQITRLDTYTNIGTDDKKNLVPLDSIGDDF